MIDFAALDEAAKKQIPNAVYFLTTRVLHPEDSTRALFYLDCSLADQYGKHSGASRNVCNKFVVELTEAQDAILAKHAKAVAEMRKFVMGDGGTGAFVALASTDEVVPIVD
jgi:hypothetical protein